MSDADETDRAARIQALLKAARVERAKALRRWWQSLFGRERHAGMWPARAEPAIGDCG